MIAGALQDQLACFVLCLQEDLIYPGPQGSEILFGQCCHFFSRGLKRHTVCPIYLVFCEKQLIVRLCFPGTRKRPRKSDWELWSSGRGAQVISMRIGMIVYFDFDCNGFEWFDTSWTYICICRYLAWRNARTVSNFFYTSHMVWDYFDTLMQDLNKVLWYRSINIMVSWYRSINIMASRYHGIVVLISWHQGIMVS